MNRDCFAFRELSPDKNVNIPWCHSFSVLFCKKKNHKCSLYKTIEQAAEDEIRARLIARSRGYEVD